MNGGMCPAEVPAAELVDVQALDALDALEAAGGGYIRVGVCAHCGCVCGAGMLFCGPGCREGHDARWRELLRSL